MTHDSAYFRQRAAEARAAASAKGRDAEAAVAGEWSDKDFPELRE